MKHTIVIELPDHLPVDSVEQAVTQAIVDLEIWDEKNANDEYSSVNYASPTVVAYHHEDVTSMEEDDTITYGPDVPKRWVERRMDQMHEGDSFGIHDVEGDAILRVVKYTRAEDQTSHDAYSYTSADRRVRHGSRAEVLEELFPS